MKVLLKLLPLILFTPRGFAAEPSMFRGNAAHSGVYDSAVSPTLSTVKWKFQTASKIVSSPAISGSAIYIGSSDHNLYSLNLEDGSLRWKFATGGPVNSSPAVVGGLVYAASVDGNFYAVDAGTGKKKWSFQTGGERRFTAPGIHGATPHTEMMPDPFDIFLSSAAVSGDMVYFGSGDHNVYALDAQTGDLKWKFATGNVVHASPAVADGIVYIGSWDRNLYALNAQTGTVVWKFQTGDDTEIYNQVGIASSAVVAGGVVYFGCRDGHLYALDARTGAEKWNHDNHKGWVIASPAVWNGKVCFPTSDGARFKVLDAATGKVEIDLTNKAFSYSSPAVSGDTVYYGSSDGWLQAVDLKTGKLKAQFQTDGSRQNASRYTDASGKIAGNVYPDSTLDGIIIGLDRLSTLGSVFSSPVVANGVIYFGSTDGHLYAVL